MARRPQQVSRRDRRLQPKIQTEQRKQRAVLVVAVIIILIALAVPAYGYYATFIKPPRVVTGKVGNTKYTMGWLVKQLRVYQAQDVFQNDPTALASAPLEVLYNTMQNELVRQGAIKQGITVTRAEVDTVIHNNFYPKPPEGQTVDPGQLQKEYEENLRTFLTRTTLSLDDYRKTIELSLYRDRMRDELGKQVPTVGDQREVWWILVGQDPNTGTANPQPVMDRLNKGEDFATVAQETNTESTYANAQGYVGWVPKGAFPELDNTIWNAETGKIYGPLNTSIGTLILKVTGGPEAREISAPMISALKDVQLNTWIQTEWSTEAGDGRLAIQGFSGPGWGSEEYNWIAKQLRLSAPATATPTPAP